MNMFGQETVVGSTKIVDHITWNENHPFIDHFKFANTIFSLPFDGFFKEFDDDKYCDFRILRKLNGQRVALGLVSTRSDEPEDKAKLVAKVKDVAIEAFGL